MTTSLLILARAFHYGSGMVLVGMVAFRWLFLLPAFAGEQEETWQKFAPLLARLNRMFIASGVVLVLSGLALFWAVAAGMSDTSLMESLNDETLGTVFFQTQFGAVFQWRLGLAVFMATLIWWLAQTRWQFQRQRSMGEIVAGITAVALMVSLAWTGHAVASGGPDILVRITADALHLFVTGIWPTGVLPLAMFLAEARRNEDCPAPVLWVVGRFANISLGIVWVVIVTGIINGYFMIGRFGALFSSTYRAGPLREVAAFCGDPRHCGVQPVSNRPASFRETRRGRCSHASFSAASAPRCGGVRPRRRGGRRGQRVGDDSASAVSGPHVARRPRFPSGQIGIKWKYARIGH